jgi:hypothetical protein
MAIVTHGHPGGMTVDLYEEGNRRLRESGAFQAPEHLFHACFGDPNDLQIFGVWETREAWDGRVRHPIRRQAVSRNR